MTLSPLLETSRAGHGVLGDYRGLENVYDELLGPDGQMRPHWLSFVRSLDALGLREFTHRWQEATQLIRQNGVTYNVYGDPRGLDRPWQLDPIPLLISTQDGATLQTGLVQRARLLEAILSDLYGPQRCLHQGVLPPEIIFANPSFLRACHGLFWPGNRLLHLVAFDLVRTPDGTIRVLSDRTQAPSGAGYALENRIVLARMLPELFRLCKVQRLAAFFRTLRDTLRELAPHNRDNPRAVLLTPGPFNETYFEHAYLARYLGYILAEGGDLTVRDNRVYLKQLNGLQPVDILWRRLDDDFCDPLELRSDSFLGIPGLVQAVRAGNVVIANALGSGLAESPALIPYLPALCRLLLHEELQIPSVPVFWCGDDKARSHVLNNLHNLVIKPAFRPARLEPVFGDRLSREQRQLLVDRIRARPWDYVAQEAVALSSAPVLTESGVEPRHLVVRTYLAATPKSFILMSGGLTRITPSTESMTVSMQKGGGSKDTWVLTDGAVNEFSLLPAGEMTAVLNRGGDDLPSRAADNLFWLGRYVERAEGMVRLLRGILVRLTERSGVAEAPELPALLRGLTYVTQTFPGFLGEDARLSAPEAELRSLIQDSERIGSLAYNLRAVYRAAGSVRDRMSMDMWRMVSDLWRSPLTSGERDVPPTLSDLLDRLNDGVITLAGFGGLAAESMTRGHAWRFLDMGRKIERALHTIALLRRTLVTPTPHEPAVLEALLEIADSVMTYRRRYLSGVQPAAVLDLLLADESNPRAVVFQLLALRDLVDQIPAERTHAGRSAEQRLVLSLVTAVQLVDLSLLTTADSRGQRPHLEVLLARLEKDLPGLSDSISHRYLSHLQRSRQLAAEPVDLSSAT
jgi:uncharacterized circularly permuted ATP-grasp superfamily protein/uncharacterized alpha-E superfamily protein